jgi:cell fate regulator YaaT (PSP1 superfamily)
LTNTKLVKYYKKLMEEVDTEYPEYEKIIMAYEDRIRQIQTIRRRKYGKKS